MSRIRICPCCNHDTFRLVLTHNNDYLLITCALCRTTLAFPNEGSSKAPLYLLCDPRLLDSHFISTPPPEP